MKPMASIIVESMGKGEKSPEQMHREELALIASDIISAMESKDAKKLARTLFDFYTCCDSYESESSEE